MPREASPDTSPNGSIATVLPSASSRNADWPYHSTSMCLLLDRGDETHPRRLLGMLVAAAAQERRRGGNEAGEDRERERLVQAGAEGPGDEVREERRAGDHGPVVRRQRGQRVRAEQVLDRFVAEEGR